MFVTDVHRSTRYWTQGDALVEVSLDRGEIVAGARSASRSSSWSWS